ncbi:MAG TPA: hypothetical protein PLM07_01075 [Candidatus Rifleibacterium sp.]|nr:hypothetical protein [Candidatus Rifleibacterium sp.]HPT44473.1 hypothetical protein [Candidatus Rifleibacterium sp.]
MQTQNEKPIETTSPGPPPVPPVRDVFPVSIWGLPLNFKDNLLCSLIIILALALQIRLNNTPLGEGWLVLPGLISYLALRFWLLQLRYPDPGEIVVGTDRVILPVSVTGGAIEEVVFADCRQVRASFFKTRGGTETLTEIEFSGAWQHCRVKWLVVDLHQFERVLIRRGVQVTRHPSAYERIFSRGTLLILLSLVLILAVLLVLR